MLNRLESAFLCLDDGEVIPARVEDVSADACELVLAEAPRAPYHELLAGGAVLQWVTVEGVAGVAGVVRSSEVERRRALGLRVRFQRHGRAQLLQRREYVRVPHTASVVLTRVSPRGMPRRCRTVDLSAGGLRVTGLGAAATGALYAFRLELECGDWPIEGTCQVVRETAEGDHAVEFTTIAAEDRDRLIAFAFRRERRLERMRREAEAAEGAEGADAPAVAARDPRR